MACPTSQFSNKRMSLSINTKDFLGKHHAIQKDYPKGEYKINRTQTQSSLTIGCTREDKLGIRTNEIDKHRGKCMVLST